MRFSQSTGCFYPFDIVYLDLPDDLVEVTPQAYDAAMARQPGESLLVVEGELTIVPAPALTEAQKLSITTAAMTSSVQRHMDAAARSLGYDSLLSAISYADEPAIAKFQSDGRALRAWRSQVWAQCHTLLEQVQAGTLALPSEAELVALLPEVAL